MWMDHRAAVQTSAINATHDKALAYVAKLTSEAALLARLADAGAAKQTARYNALVAFGAAAALVSFFTFLSAE